SGREGVGARVDAARAAHRARRRKAVDRNRIADVDDGRARGLARPVEAVRDANAAAFARAGKLGHEREVGAGYAVGRTRLTWRTEGRSLTGAVAIDGRTANGGVRTLLRA